MTTAAETKTYTVKAVRFGGWWAIDVPEIKGVHTQARKLDNVEAMARDAIAVALDIAPDAFDVAVSTELDEATLRLVEDAQRTREEAARAQARAAAALAVSVEHMRVRGLTVRDTGRLLGLSHQRVAQVLTSRGSMKNAGGVSRKASKTVKDSTHASIDKRARPKR